jgi:hypothetical protein
MFTFKHNTSQLAGGCADAVSLKGADKITIHQCKRDHRLKAGNWLDRSLLGR